MLVIDGSMGEGGGQILRSALALSLCSGKGFRMIRIRAGRKRPGLRAQHLASVEAAVQVGRAHAEGAWLGSQELTFFPRGVHCGQYHFDIGTAGSTTLVLQTVLPALMRGDAPSTIVLRGGTHNPLAPPFDFLHEALLPLLARMGPQITARLDRPGYYPRGGGCLEVFLRPARCLRPVHIPTRGRILNHQAVATVAGLPRHIAVRELEVVGRILGWDKESLVLKEEPSNWGPGNCLSIKLECENVTEVFTGFGMKGVKAETVGTRAAEAARRYIQSGAAVGEFLADQLLLPLSLVGEGSFLTLKPTSHTQTNAQIIRFFLDVSIAMDPVGPHTWKIHVSS